MAAKATGKTAATKTARRAKKGDSKKPAAKRAEARPAGDTVVQQLEQKLREAEARARQLEQDAREVQGRARRLERELEAAQAALEARVTAQERSKPASGNGSAVAILVDGVTKLRCPRCSGAMTEYQHQVVRADRCDSCHGIFFDNGELEQVVDKAMADRDGEKHGGWFVSLFGRREKST